MNGKMKPHNGNRTFKIGRYKGGFRIWTPNPLNEVGDDKDKAERHQDLLKILFIKQAQESPLYDETGQSTHDGTGQHSKQ